MPYSHGSHTVKCFAIWCTIFDVLGFVKPVGRIRISNGPTIGASLSYSRDQLNTFRSEVSQFYRHDLRDTETNLAKKHGILARRLMEQRYTARKHRNFDKVQRLDEQLLRKLGIRVYDYPPIWTTLEKPPRAHVRRRLQQRLEAMLGKYGPQGHPYFQVGEKHTNAENCSLCVPDIHKMLGMLQMACDQGKVATADAIKRELLIHGVRLHDEWHQWTIDPCHEFIDIPRQNRSPNLYLNRTQGTLQISNRSREETRIAKRIESLVQARSDAIFCQDTITAACIEYELHKTYAVAVDDESLTYYTINHCSNSASCPAFLTALSKRSLLTPIRSLPNDRFDSPNYRQSRHSKALSDPGMHHRIKELILTRIHKRQESKFREADALRRELWESYHVGINDRLRQYSVGGIFDND